MTETNGNFLNDRYRLVEVIGAGGMGRVWLGRDEFLERDVAVKEILFPPGLEAAQRRELTQRAMREARSAARLNHPGIVTVHDVISRDEAPVIIMEFVRGRSLAQAIAEDGRMSPERVAAIGMDMVEALAEAHQAGIVHRDLKPANILLAGRRPVITDFGIASLAGDATLTASGVLVGTPAFMAPEQARGEQVTPACDLWSLGASLYAAVEGKAPYTGTSVIAILSALLSDEPEPPVHAGPLTPLLAGLLHKDPAQRFTAEQAAQALQAVIRHSDTEPPRPASGNAQTVLQAGADRTTAESPDHALTEMPRAMTAVAPAPPLASPSPGLQRRHVFVLGGLGLAAALGAFVVNARRTPRILTRHGDQVNLVVLSPDGRYVASADRDGTIKMTELETQTDALFTSDPRPFEAMAFSPDGRTLATEGPDATVRLWDVKSRKTAAVLKGHTNAVRAVAFSPDGRHLATAGSDRTICLWDTDDHKTTATLKGHKAPVLSVAFSPAGETLATSDDAGMTRVWSMADHKAIAIFEGPPGEPVRSVAFSPDGVTMAIGTMKEAVVFDTRTWSSTGSLEGHSADVLQVAFSPDGGTLASAGADKDVRLWDMATRTVVATYEGHTDAVRSVAFSPDGQSLVSAGADGLVQLWDVG